MAGSGAIITAWFRALCAFYDVKIAPPIMANLVLAVETAEPGIPAGLQDRVAQVYDGRVYMDFDCATMERQGYGLSEPLDPAALPPLYIAYRRDLAEGTEVFHSHVRARWEAGDPDVRAAMTEWVELARRARDLILAGRGAEIGPLLNANFDFRRKIFRISQGNIRMVKAARSIGASARFTGSGGGIVGTYEGEPMCLCPEEELAWLGGPCAIAPFRPAHSEGSSMIAVVPAAGLGTRFLPVSKSQPKEMLSIVD